MAMKAVTARGRDSAIPGTDGNHAVVAISGRPHSRVSHLSWLHEIHNILVSRDINQCHNLPTDEVISLWAYDQSQPHDVITTDPTDPIQTFP